MSDNNPQGVGSGEQNAAYNQDPQSTQPPPYGHYHGYPPHMMHPQFTHQHPHQQMGQTQFPPAGHMPPPMWHHPMWMQHPAFCHPSMMPPPNWHHPHMHPAMHQAMSQGMHQGMYQGMQSPTAAPNQEQNEANDALFEQAQAMLEGAMGEEAGMFKEILGSLGMNDKEFWKGAMVGAAAALLLSNENVRGKLMGLVSGAGDALKTGGCAVKETATNTAHSVKENVSTGGEIFRDTYAAGKQGFQESVERHKEAKQEETTQVEPEQVIQPVSEENQDVKPV
ncbi:YtxH domain-containing protein [Vibrio ponticus]|uniref:YtxH domain-containing protein n=1 Tax=Vibrio ponticus TaxID=265668 RepID=UPI001E39B678|nr:YtxH domain-containing protein [Vibrio ponticus]